MQGSGFLNSGQRTLLFVGSGSKTHETLHGSVQESGFLVQTPTFCDPHYRDSQKGGAHTESLRNLQEAGPAILAVSKGASKLRTCVQDLISEGGSGHEQRIHAANFVTKLMSFERPPVKYLGPFHGP